MTVGNNTNLINEAVCLLKKAAKYNLEGKHNCVDGALANLVDIGTCLIEYEKKSNVIQFVNNIKNKSNVIPFPKQIQFLNKDKKEIEKMIYNGAARLLNEIRQLRIELYTQKTEPLKRFEEIVKLDRELEKLQRIKQSLFA